MFRGFDHVSIVVADLQRTIADLKQLGFHVTHRLDAGVGETENRLVCFDDGSYFEILSFRDPSQPSANRWRFLLYKGDGWADYSIRTQDMDGEIVRLTGLDVPMIGPRLGGKTGQDGRPWQVRSLLLGRGGAGSPVLPFLIEDLSPRELRVPLLPRDVAQIGRATGIAGVTILTANLGAVEASLTKVFGKASTTPIRHKGAAEARLFRVADRWLEVVEVKDDSSEIGRYMAGRGEGVYEVTLGAEPYDTPGPATALPAELTHGARVVLASPRT